MINTPEFVFGNVRDYRRLTRALAADENGADPKLFFLPLELAKLGPPTDNESAEVAGTRQTLNNILQTSDVFEGFSEEDGKRTLHSFKIVQKIQQQTVRNPLQVQYFSAAPFRYGPDRVMKFSVAPLEGEVPQAKFSPQEITALDPNYLAQALKNTLTQGKEIRLSFSAWAR